MIIYTDANRKQICYVVVSPFEETMVGDIVHKAKTANYAELLAILIALKQYPQTTEVRSDSSHAVRYLSGLCNVYSRTSLPLVEKIWREIGADYYYSKVLHYPTSGYHMIDIPHLISKGKVKFTWTPRSENLAGLILAKLKHDNKMQLIKDNAVTNSYIERLKWEDTPTENDCKE